MTMKKIITLLALISCLIVTIPASAQVRLGIKVGTNLPKNTFEDLNYNIDVAGVKQSLSLKNSTGFFVGPTLDVKVPILGLGFDAGLNYSLRRVTMEYENSLLDMHENKTNSQHMLEIPINLKYTFSVGNLLGIYAAVGPAFSFNLNKNSFWDDMSEIAGGVISSEGGKYVRNTAEVSINAGVGVILLNHLQVGVNYNWGLTDDAKASGEDFVNAAWNGKAVKNRMWQVSLAYLF